MKTQLRLPQKSLFGLFLLVMVTALSFNTVQAQETQGERTVTGQVFIEDEGPLETASVILKGSDVGTVTDILGKFTFPQPLKPGDVLVISYLGFKTVEVVIKEDTTFVKVVVTEDVVEFVGELNTNKPYKSKRPKKSE